MKQGCSLSALGNTEVLDSHACEKATLGRPSEEIVARTEGAIGCTMNWQSPMKVICTDDRSDCVPLGSPFPEPSKIPSSMEMHTARSSFGTSTSCLSTRATFSIRTSASGPCATFSTAIREGAPEVVTLSTIGFPSTSASARSVPGSKVTHHSARLQLTTLSLISRSFRYRRTYLQLVKAHTRTTSPCSQFQCGIRCSTGSLE